jgi:hypothetical protein
MKILLLIFLILFSVEGWTQYSPESFLLKEDRDYFNKIQDTKPKSNSIGDIIAIGDTVWLGTSRGVSVSFDRGGTWTNFYSTSPFGEDNVSAVAYYRGTIWVATATSAPAPGGGTVPKGTGLKYTTNNGATWTAVPQPVDHPDSSTVIYGNNSLRALPVTVAEQNITYDIALTPGTVWITSFAGGTRKSTDMGQTWSRVVLPPDNLSSVHPDDSLDFCMSPIGGSFCKQGNLNYRAFSVIAVDDLTLYVGTANGINKSTDNGISWVKFNHQNQSEPISGNFITALGYNYSTNTVWASTWKAEAPEEFYAVSSSTNGGNSWKTFLHEERPHNFGFKNGEVIVPTDNGAYRSTDQGLSWILPTSIIDTISDPTSKIYLHTDIYFSAAAEGNDVWLGSNDGLVLLVETSLWRGVWKLYFAAENLKSASETYAYPNPFSPRQEQLKIIYSTENVPAQVTIRIFDFGMNYVRTIIQNVTRQRGPDGPPDFWDGTDDNGNFLPNGVYIYRVDINDDEPLFGKIIYLQ